MLTQMELLNWAETEFCPLNKPVILLFQEDVLKAYERIVYKKIPSRWNLIFANISVLPLR